MTNKTFFYVSSLLVVPTVFALFFALRLLGRAYEIDQWVLGIKHQVQRLKKSVDAPCFSSAF
jgi:hypothetical protein